MNPELRSRLTEYFGCQPEAVIAYLYGSHADNRARRDSDLDIAVLFRQQVARPERVRLSLRYSDELRRATGQEVDVRDLNEAPIAFRMQAIRPRQCLFAVQARERARFEAEVIRDYLDFKPVLDLYYMYMTAKLSRGQTLFGTGFRDHLRSVGYTPRAEGVARTPTSDDA